MGKEIKRKTLPAYRNRFRETGKTRRRDAYMGSLGFLSLERGRGSGALLLSNPRVRYI